MSTSISSASIIGLEAKHISVEVDVSFGMKAFIVVGLPDRAIRESCGRVESAIKNSGLPFPRYRITVNLAPAHLKKEGPAYDVPIAIGILQTTGELPKRCTDKTMIVGELGLDGDIRPVTGVLPIAMGAKKLGMERIVVPSANAQEAGLVEGVEIYPVKTLKELVAHLNGQSPIKPYTRKKLKTAPEEMPFDFLDVRGQEHAKRALEIAAAGGHNILLSGPPGSGKTLLARSVPSILPNMTTEEALDVTRIHSVAGTLNNTHLVKARPFQAPHHTTSGVALVGGGATPRPGQISLAHRGVLFLDEFPEFTKQALENLRQPLEDGVITVSRAAGTVTFPARFMLIAAMNPCPCGFASDPYHACTCTPTQVVRYQKKLSGPLLDRIDLHLEVPKIDVDKLSGTPAGEPSSVIRKRVQNARNTQGTRFRGTSLVANADMGAKDLNTYIDMEEDAQRLLAKAAKQLHISARSYVRVIKVARTIADLSGAKQIKAGHIAEALQFRKQEQGT